MRGFEVFVDEENLYIERERVVESKAIGHGSQYTVSLVKTESGRMFLIESGASASGPYTEVLTELTDLEIPIEFEKD